MASTLPSSYSRRSSPSTAPGTPSATASRAIGSKASAAARSQRAWVPSLRITTPWNNPAGLPDPSSAGSSWRSMTVVRHPCSASAQALAQPARPPPSTIARGATAHDCGLPGGAARRVGAGSKRATVMSRLPPCPAALLTVNPAACSPSRTLRAADQVVAVAPGSASRASALNRRGSHICGLRAGAKPSR
jgi:hypothetical protein